MADDVQRTDWLATLAALILLAAMIGFAAQGEHKGDKAWEAMVKQLGLDQLKD